MLVEKLIELKVGRSVDVHLLRRCRWTSRITMAAWRGELLSKPLQGLSPLDICVQKKHQDAGEVLVSAGAKLVKDGSVRRVSKRQKRDAKATSRRSFKAFRGSYTKRTCGRSHPLCLLPRPLAFLSFAAAWNSPFLK